MPDAVVVDPTRGWNSGCNNKAASCKCPAETPTPDPDVPTADAVSAKDIRRDCNRPAPGRRFRGCVVSLSVARVMFNCRRIPPETVPATVAAVFMFAFVRVVIFGLDVTTEAMGQP